ncbi:hypothetical protein E2562_021122 [Oryza meyeriana var. granulata]|uniref:Mechanosensitive ion channel protein n=1 Tax=Oryza meyeriana var. granulata TaxID=110450 RepID=A0A6G1BME8_9ORYZ|nr:hypothetical protein E2562_021122 [Oryza meyeriana var. granulata]
MSSLTSHGWDWTSGAGAPPSSDFSIEYHVERTIGHLASGLAGGTVTTSSPAPPPKNAALVSPATLTPTAEGLDTTHFDTPVRYRTIDNLIEEDAFVLGLAQRELKEASLLLAGPGKPCSFTKAECNKAWCAATQEDIDALQKFLVDMRNPNDSRNMGFDFTVKAVYTGIWIAAISLFMELLGFNTQKWITAGGFGTVLLTLAGREIFTNFLSSVMINATRPFVVNEWINTKIDGVEVSGIVEHVGWWSPTIIRGDDREAIYIPNHKFTVSILRNNTQRNHWRIKTYLALSHMDAAKIGIIVADMRKVLAKNPHIEQQRLHRRVFFEKIDPKTQALMIYISCFVKTSHFEEYLNVQEAVMLDLLRIVGHHRARLATQIRTVQKSYGNADIDNVPFGEEMYSRVRGRTLLIDTSARISDDKSKPRPASREEHKVKTVASAEAKSVSPDNASLSNNSEKQEQKKSVPEDGRMKNSKNDHVTTTPLSSVWSENMDPVASTFKTGKGKTQGAVATERGDGDGSVSVANSKKESRPVFEDNIVLGLALEGSKRTLPIDDGMNRLSLSETEQDTVEAASSPKDKKGQ